MANNLDNRVYNSLRAEYKGLGLYASGTKESLINSLNKYYLKIEEERYKVKAFSI